MLGKLIKYEIKATSRLLLPLYCGIILFSIFSKISLHTLNIYEVRYMATHNSLINFIVTTMTFISFFLYAFVIITTFIMTIVIAIRRFYKNLLSDEGYLMFTIPVNTNNLILSKLLTTIIWYIISIIVTIFSLMILSFSDDFFENIGKFYFFLQRISYDLSSIPEISLTVILIMLLIIIAFPSSILMIYASIAIGHTRHTHRLLYSFVAYLVIGFIMNIIYNVLSFFLTSPLNYITLNSSSISNINLLISQVNIYLVMNIILSLLFSAVFYYITYIVLSKKLNLE